MKPKIGEESPRDSSKIYLAREEKIFFLLIGS